MPYKANTGLTLNCISAAFVLILVLSGCAAVQSKNNLQAPTKPPGQGPGSKALPVPEAGPAPRSLAPTGSLWAPNSGSLWAPSNGSLFADIRASKIGDIVTITVSETSSGSKASATANSKSNQFQGSLTFGGVGVGSGGGGVNSPKGAFSLGPYNGAFSSSFNGSGATSQTDTMTAYMEATVIDVLPNGNLVIRGSRWTKVNDELQQIVLEGVIRQADISSSNTVLSQDVAEAKIFLLGKGPVTRYQKPGWLGQLWDFISPF